MRKKISPKIEFAEKLVEFNIGLKQSGNKELAEHSAEVAQIARIILHNLKNFKISLDEKTKNIFKYLDIDTVADIYELHDLGKLFIPDYILNAPRRLTEEEFKVVQNHPLFTERFVNCVLLQKSISDKHLDAFYEAILLISREHHENYDGTGYPNKLKGDEISLLGRIARVADVISALMGTRCYNREFNNFEEIEAHLRKNKGTLFDPQIVDMIIPSNNDSYKQKNNKKEQILNVFDIKLIINELINDIMSQN